MFFDFNICNHIHYKICNPEIDNTMRKPPTNPNPVLKFRIDPDVRPDSLVAFFNVKGYSVHNQTCYFKFCVDIKKWMYNKQNNMVVVPLMNIPANFAWSSYIVEFYSCNQESKSPMNMPANASDVIIEF